MSDNTLTLSKIHGDDVINFTDAANEEVFFREYSEEELLVIGFLNYFDDEVGVTLDRELAEKLWPYLKTFSETGSIEMELPF